MRFLSADGDHLVFHLGKREKSHLLDLLKLYPLIPVGHHRLGTAGSAVQSENNQELLEEALAEQRAQNKKALDAMVQEPHRFQETATGFRLQLTPVEVEWLLQVLNDIRVGSWLKLGSPDEQRGKRLRLNLKNARFLWAMELCGHFEHSLITGPQS